MSLETKSARADGAVAGPAQLAMWVRAQFKHLEQVGKDGELLMLPVVFVQGEKWRVDFAERREGRLVSYTRPLRWGEKDSAN